MRDAGISVCAGGIIGLGEGPKDRVGLIHQLATLPSHPESVPINSLVSVAGTPLEGREAPSGLDLARSGTPPRLLHRTVAVLGLHFSTRLFPQPAWASCVCSLLILCMPT